MLDDQGLELARQLGVTTKCEISLHPILDRAEPPLIEARHLRAREGLGRELTEGTPPPPRSTALEDQPLTSSSAAV